MDKSLDLSRYGTVFDQTKRPAIGVPKRNRLSAAGGGEGKRSIETRGRGMGRDGSRDCLCGGASDSEPGARANNGPAPPAPAVGDVRGRLLASHGV